MIWSVPLVATLAIVGALAVFMSVAPGGLLANELNRRATEPGGGGP